MDSVERHSEKSNEQQYVVTLDVDWAPDSSIERCLQLLGQAGVKAMFFATHHTDLNKEILLQGHDIGIHPNFLPGSTHGTSVGEIMDACLEFAPDAWCMRTHALVQSTPLLYEIFNTYRQLTMDVSLFMHKAPCVPRTKFRFSDISFDRILFNWEDDAEFAEMGFHEKAQQFFGPTTIFNFHPIHVHLNSSNGKEYQDLKNGLSGRRLSVLSKQEVSAHINQGTGVESFFRSIITSGEKSLTLRDIPCEST